MGFVVLITLYFFTYANAKFVLNFQNASSSMVQRSESGEAIPGRTLEIPAQDYMLAFKVKAPTLGECALQMRGNTIKTCSEKFGGVEIWIPRALTAVDVSKVQTADDVLTHGMGGIGVNVGILGLVSAGVKVNVAVTTQTSNKHLTLMSSYDLKLGTKTLHNPQPLTEIGAEGTIYLSEIEFGGNEMLLVTLEFESVQTKVKVQGQLQIKILFITITAKLRYVKETFSSTSKTRVQFRSSWRENLDKTYTSLDEAIEEVEKIENMYASGPEDLKRRELNDEKLHQTYHFSSWKKSPFGKNTNEGVISNELAVLNSQYTELNAVIKRIDDILETRWIEFQDQKKKKAVEELKQQMTNLREKLTTGLETYHTLDQPERSQLIDAYGTEKAPGYYERRLKKIVGY